MFATAITKGRFIYNLVKLQQFLLIPCFATLNSLWLYVCKHMSAALFVLLICEGVSVLFFQMACAVLPQYTGHFFLLLKEGPRVHSCYHAPCDPLPLTFLYVAFPLSPFSCHCTLMTGVLWPLLCRQLHILAGIRRHSSAVLRQWRLHSDVYSARTSKYCHSLSFSLVGSFLVSNPTGF